MGRLQPRARSRENARWASTCASTPARLSVATKSSHDDAWPSSWGSVTDGAVCGSTVITEPKPYRAATDASPTVDFPLKLPISRITPCAGAAAAARARNRPSRSVRKPGATRTRCQASSIACARSEGTGTGAVGLGAIAVERRREVGRDVPGVASLDLPPFQHEDELPLFQQSDLGRRRGVAREVAPGARGGIGVLAGEHGGEVPGTVPVSDRERRRRARVAGGAAAHRIHDHKDRPRRVTQRRIDLLRRAQLFETDPGQLLAHRLHEAGIVQWYVQLGHAILPQGQGSSITAWVYLPTSPRPHVPVVTVESSTRVSRPGLLAAAGARESRSRIRWARRCSTPDRRRCPEPESNAVARSP